MENDETLKAKSLKVVFFTKSVGTLIHSVIVYAIFPKTMNKNSLALKQNIMKKCPLDPEILCTD